MAYSVVESRSEYHWNIIPRISYTEHSTHKEYAKRNATESYTCTEERQRALLLYSLENVV